MMYVVLHPARGRWLTPFGLTPDQDKALQFPSEQDATAYLEGFGPAAAFYEIHPMKDRPDKGVDSVLERI